MKVNDCHCLIEGSEVVYGSDNKQKLKDFDEYCKSIQKGSTGLILQKLLQEALAPVDLSKKNPVPED